MTPTPYEAIQELKKQTMDAVIMVRVTRALKAQIRKIGFDMNLSDSDIVRLGFQMLCDSLEKGKKKKK